MGPLMRRDSPQRLRGFTLVEMVVVIVIMAVLASVGASRFVDRDPFAVQGVADQLAISLRTAQASATAQRRTVYVELIRTPLALKVCFDAACTQPLAPPSGASSWLVDTEGLEFAAAAQFSFAPTGEPSFSSALALQVKATGGTASSHVVTVEPGSGLVH